MKIKRSEIFNDVKTFILKQMYAKVVKPPRAKEIVLEVRRTIKEARTDEQKTAYLKNLSNIAPELAPFQAQLEQKTHEHFDDIIGNVAEMLLDKGDFDNISVLNDWYENEKPDDEKIKLYIEYHFPDIAKEVFKEE